MEKQYEKIPAYKPDTCKNCKGHANCMLDCEYETKGERDLLVSVLEKYITKDGK